MIATPDTGCAIAAYKQLQLDAIAAVAKMDAEYEAQRGRDTTGLDKIKRALRTAFHDYYAPYGSPHPSPDTAAVRYVSLGSDHDDKVEAFVGDADDLPVGYKVIAATCRDVWYLMSPVSGNHFMKKALIAAQSFPVFHIDVLQELEIADYLENGAASVADEQDDLPDFAADEADALALHDQKIRGDISPEMLIDEDKTRRVVDADRRREKFGWF